MISVYNESLICDCDSAKILGPQHFVIVCELTSIHDNILSSDLPCVASRQDHPQRGLGLCRPSPWRSPSCYP